MSDNGKSKGGKARAASLSSEKRKEIARKAAEKRWADAPKVEHVGELRIGDLELPCAVLPDGRRVISRGAITTAFGPVTGGYQMRKMASEDGGVLPPFLIAASLKPFISEELSTVVSEPIRYRDPRGGPVRHGIDASLLPQICEVWLNASDAGALTKIQIPVAVRASILMRGLAHTGIIALVDEATGYQDARSRDALAKILEAFIDKELQPWTKTFPEAFYKEIFRLRNWSYEGLAKGEKPRRPGVLGKYTVDLVYERLAPGVYEELTKINPKNSSGRRKSHYHRWFTPELGHPKLAAHIEAITAIARISETWDQFKINVDKVYPKPNSTLPLDLI